jgi:KEOPS complex subunit Cgi121
MENGVFPCDIRTAEFTVQNQEQFLSSLRKTARDFSCSIICFDADNLAGQRHAITAVRHAIRSFRQGSPIANTLEMEALLYAAGTRQCSVASSFGIHEGFNRAYICCCPPCNEVWDALAPLVTVVTENWEVISKEKRLRLASLFAIPDDELAAAGESRFADLVIERVALLDVFR